MAARTRFIDIKGTRVLLMDFSGFEDANGALSHIAEAKTFVAGQPRNSLRTLVDVSGSRFNPDVANAIKDLAAHNRPFVIRGAVVGLGGLQKIVYQAVLAFSGRTNLKAFGTRDEAEAWLAGA